MPPETRYKQFITVCEKFKGQPILAVPSIKENKGQLSSRDIWSSRNEPVLRVKTIGESQDAIVTVVLWQGPNKVHSDRLTPAVRNWQGVQGPRWFVSRAFVPLTL